MTKDIKYIGVNDHQLDLFEGQYIVPNGMAYNSYAILDEKIAIMDSVEANFTEQWFGNIEEALSGREPDYLIVQHMEPDHSGSLFKFAEKYPNTKIVASSKVFNMVKNFYGMDFEEKKLVVGDGDKLTLGQHELSFVTAPMVHWPEVIMTYDSKDKVLFSADAFGKFGALDVEEDWACEARRYYFGIVGKYGAQVQAVMKKLASFEIKAICPLHGPALTENLEYYINLYNTWSSYGIEEEGVVIAYTSVYGNTKKAALKLEELLHERGVEKVAVNDLARCDMAEAVEDAFRYGTLILATTTYNGDMFPTMKHFINELLDHAYQNRRIAFVENGTWGPMAAKKMRAMTECMKNITYADHQVTVTGGLNDASRAQIEALAEELA